MKQFILIAAMLVAVGSASAQGVAVERQPLGSGQPEAVGIEPAIKWDNNIYHAPQYMPGHPTAATLYPRVVDVQCTQAGTILNCKGYNWLPELGRGEYLMIRPTVVKAPVVPAPVVREVFIEVPVKKKKE